MVEQQNLEGIMKLVMNGGEAKTQAMAAVNEAKKNNFDKAHEHIKLAEKALIEAHHSQTDMLTKEAQNSSPTETTLLMVHAQDHLMTAIIFIDLIKEIVALYQKIASVGK